MPSAARVGDLTAHGTPLTPAAPPGGSLTVQIGGQPAWRATSDIHVCPLVTGTVPHTGGVVMKGSTDGPHRRHAGRADGRHHHRERAAEHDLGRLPDRRLIGG